ncbi:hypothetical protein [Nocardia sp. NPDC004123]
MDFIINTLPDAAQAPAPSLAPDPAVSLDRRREIEVVDAAR